MRSCYLYVCCYLYRTATMTTRILNISTRKSSAIAMTGRGIWQRQLFGSFRLCSHPSSTLRPTHLSNPVRALWTAQKTGSHCLGVDYRSDSACGVHKRALHVTAGASVFPTCVLWLETNEQLQKSVLLTLEQPENMVKSLDQNLVLGMSTFVLFIFCFVPFFTGPMR